MKNILHMVLTVILLISCSPKSIDQYKLWKMAEEADPTAKILLPKMSEEGIKCSDYGPGCLSGRRVMVKKVEFILIEFQKEDQAHKEAIRIDQFYFKNWLFDDITGEKVLEAFVRKAFDAKRPKIDEAKKSD